MKHLLILTLLLLSIKSYSQLSLSEMMAIYKMDLDQFENFALKKGYHFSSLDDNEHAFGVAYKKGTAKNTKYIQLYTKWFSDGRAVSTQTSIEKDIIILKEEMQKKGFKLNDIQTFDGKLKKVYTYGNWTLSIWSIDEGFEINLKM